MKNYRITTALAAILLLLTATACSWTHDDLDDCPSGIRLTLQAASETQDDLLSEVQQATVVVLDSVGRHLDTFAFSGDAVRLGNGTVHLPLSAGRYQLVVWTNQESPEYVHFTESDDFSQKSPFVCLLTKENLSDSYLTPLWQGATSSMVSVGKTTETATTVLMTRHVKQLTVVLQDVTGGIINADRYHFHITCDNSRLSPWGSVLRTGSLTTYSAYLAQSVDAPNDDETVIIGQKENAKAIVARAEMNTLRLTPNDGSRLIVTDRTTARTILNIPLTEYLLLVREQYQGRKGLRLTPQEFLDKECHYDIVFFLQPTGNETRPYILARVMVKGWIVRLNEDITFKS